MKYVTNRQVAAHLTKRGHTTAQQADAAYKLLRDAIGSPVPDDWSGLSKDRIDHIKRHMKSFNDAVEYTLEGT